MKVLAQLSSDSEIADDALDGRYRCKNWPQIQELLHQNAFDLQRI